MLQNDGRPAPDGVAARQAWMRLLSRAPLELLEAEVAPLAGPGAQWLRRPETGLVMVQGRAGGSGERFHLGEVTVTRCALRTDPTRVACARVGIAYVMGRSARHAELAATADALLQDEEAGRHLPRDLLERIDCWLRTQQAQRREKARATRVEFFTLARESGVETGTGEGD